MLVSAVRGDELVGRDASSCTRPDLFTNIDAQAIRLAIDDFAAILKEIKGTLGKR